MIYQSPQIEQEHYDEGYYKGKNTYSYVDEREDRVIRDIENYRRIKNIRRFVTPRASKYDLLDIGCSFGALTEAAINQDMNALGVDISPFIAIERKHDVTFQCRDIERGPIGKFDAITMIEVIEHLCDPDKAIENCAKSLRDGGLIVIQTTNMDSIVRRFEGMKSGYFLPGHTHYFSTKTITRLLNKHGFKVEKIYFGHETGFVTAMIRKMMTNLHRHGMSDFICFCYTFVTHVLSKLHIGNLAIHNGMVVYARKVKP